MSRRSCRTVAFLFVLVFGFTSVAFSTQWTKELAKGIELTQIVQPRTETSPARVFNVVKVDPKAPGVRIQMVLGNDIVWGTDPTNGRETIGSMAKRLKATVVINTDFCDWTGDPLGLHISNGELISEPYKNRTMFGITSDGRFLFDRLEFDAKIMLPDGKWFPIRGINRPVGDHELVVYTPKFFASTCTKDNGSEAVLASSDLPLRLGTPIHATVVKIFPDSGNTTIPPDGIVLSGRGTGSEFIKSSLSEGMEVTLEFNVKGETTTGWEKVVEATGGTPRLIRDGKISVEAEKENQKPDSPFVNVTHPRSAIGVTGDGKLLLVTVDGRQNVSTGMPLKELAEFMLSQGCVDAMNLDGGGSTTLSTWWGTLNSPSDGWLRPLPNALAVFGEESAEPEIDFKIVAPEGPIATRSTYQLRLVDSSGNSLAPELQEKAVWSMNGVTNFVDQAGVLHAERVGQTEVAVRLGGKTATLLLDVVSGSTDKLMAELKPEPSGDVNKNVLNVLLVDAAGKPIAGRMVSVKVTGGSVNQPWITTDAEGRGSFVITWSGEAGVVGEVTARSGDIQPVTIRRPQ